MSNEYLDIAMEKVIKQEVNAVLNKIRAEIEALEDKMLNLPNDWRTSEVFENVFDVIDKYKAESEET